MDKRNEQIDVMRGTGILLMVYGHCCRANSVVALFHMPLFFIISGYCFNDDNCASIRIIGLYFKRKVKSLWVPYFLYTSLFLLCTNIFIRVGIYTNNSSLLTINNSSIDKIHQYLGIKDYAKMFAMEFLFQTETQLGGGVVVPSVFVFLQYSFCPNNLFVTKDISKNICKRIYTSYNFGC